VRFRQEIVKQGNFIFVFHTATGDKNAQYAGNVARVA
jgi:hypothetical protein